LWKMLPVHFNQPAA